MLIALMLLLTPWIAAPTTAATPAPTAARDASKDWAFLMGRWHTHYRLLKKRLANNHDWYDCYGTSVVTPFWGGNGNLEDGDLKCPSKHIIGMTVRVYDTTKHQWQIWWGTSKHGIEPPPQLGNFSNGVGEFFANDKFEGKPIVVRFRWTLKNALPRFEQAFSPDNGRTWETNWTTDYTRAT